MANKIQFRRGLKANLPVLSVGEPAFTTDTKELFIGSDAGNIDVTKNSLINDLSDNKTVKDNILPFKLKKLQLKGQMHCHSTTSDGKYTPTALLTLYKNAGYDFVAITDHDTVNPNVDVDGIIHIRSSEYYGGAYHAHLCAYDTVNVRPDLNSTMFYVQDSINFIKRNKGLTSFAHPQMGSLRVLEDEALLTKDYNMMEIFTAYDSSYYGNFIDNLLKKGKQFNFLAVDDFHNEDANTFNGGWIVVNCDTKDPTVIMDEISKGNYYSSNGNNIALSLTNGVLTATSTSASNFTFITDQNKVTVNNATSASYSIKGNEIFIRVESKRVTDGKSAWSNPIFLNRKVIALNTNNMVKPYYAGTGTLPAVVEYKREDLVYVANKTNATCYYDNNEFTITSGTGDGVAGLLFSTYNKEYAGRSVLFSFDVYRLSGSGSINAFFYYSSGDVTDVTCSSNRVAYNMMDLYTPLKTSISNEDNYVHYEFPVTIPNNISSLMIQVKTSDDNTVFKVRNFKLIRFSANQEQELEKVVSALNYSEIKLSSYLSSGITTPLSDASFAYKQSNMVYVNSILNGSISSNVTIMTLPAGYRPTKTYRIENAGFYLYNSIWIPLAITVDTSGAIKAMFFGSETSNEIRIRFNYPI